MHCGDPVWLHAWPPGPMRPGRRGGREHGGSGWAPASADTGPARFPRLLLPAPSRRLPKSGTPGASPRFGEGDRPSGLPRLAACLLRSLVRAESAALPSSRLALLRCAPRATVPPRVTVRAREHLPPPRRLPTWRTCEEMSGRGGPRSVALSLSGARGSGRGAPRPGRDAASWRCGGARQPMGTEEVGPRAAVNLPGTGARRRERASRRRAPGRGGGAAGVGGGAASSSPRTTARQGCGGPTPVPR